MALSNPTLSIALPFPTTPSSSSSSQSLKQQLLLPNPSSLLHKLHRRATCRSPEDRLKALFSGRIRKLMDEEAVKKWEAKQAWLCNDNERVSKLLRRHNHLWSFSESNETLMRNISEIQLVESRIREFKSTMNCLLNYLAAEKDGEDDEVTVMVESMFNH
ncbi:hypothetical protein ACFX2I_011120 [Malus domestica]